MGDRMFGITRRGNTMKIFIGAADSADNKSMAVALRRKRFQFFLSLLDATPKPCRILDVGGRESYWRSMGYMGAPDVQIILLNLKDVETTTPYISGMVGDATNMPQFANGEFDIVYSNSVIEHLFNEDAQRRMAAEVMRVGKRHFIQTPNRYFPIEPHFHMPFFQFMPLPMQTYLLTHMALGNLGRRIADPEEAKRIALEIRLLSKRQFQRLFPDSKIYTEALYGLAKSYIAYGGW